MLYLTYSVILSLKKLSTLIAQKNTLFASLLKELEAYAFNHKLVVNYIELHTGFFDKLGDFITFIF